MHPTLRDGPPACIRSGLLRAASIPDIRLKCLQERVKEGLEEAPVLWTEYEQVRRTEQDWRREIDGLTAQARHGFSGAGGRLRWTVTTPGGVEIAPRRPSVSWVSTVS